MAGRKRRFCASLPNAAMTGPISATLNASGLGTAARSISSVRIARLTGDQLRPPHSAGQCGTA
jgi:hypothetical protein